MDGLIDRKELASVLTLRASKILRNASLILVALYGIAFVFLKTYLSYFGFQIELTSLSVTDLLLAHRHFAAQHYFVGFGVLQVVAVYRYGWAEVRQHPVSASLMFLSPAALFLVGFVASDWSEQAVSRSLNITANHWVGFALGWTAGASLSWVVHEAARRVTSFQVVTWAGASVLAVLVVVWTYRYFAVITAVDRDRRSDFQLVDGIQTETEPISGVFRVVYVDSRALYLVNDTERRIVPREGLRAFKVVESPDSQMEPTRR